MESACGASSCWASLKTVSRNCCGQKTTINGFCWSLISILPGAEQYPGHTSEREKINNHGLLFHDKFLVNLLFF
jgi:hypothetical protein